MESELDKVKLELINLYLNIKIRTQDEVNSLTEENLLLETENIFSLPISDIIEYIKSTIDIIVSIRVDTKINDYKNSLNEDSNTATKYETLLQKLESSLRQHIAYEHQFKIEYEKLMIKSEEISNEKKELELEVEKLEEENKILRKNEVNLKEQIETKEKELIQSQIKLKELKAIKSANNFYNNNNNTTNINNNNYRTKSYISKSNSSINIHKDNLSEKKDNMNYYTNFNNNSLINNINTKIRFNKIKKTCITNPSITLNNLTLSLHNMKKLSNSKNKHKKQYNNSINYFNKKYINNLTTILFNKEPKKNYIKKDRNASLMKNNNNKNMNKSMLDLFPSRNFNYIFNNNNNKKYINNNYINNNNYYKNNSNKRKKTKSLNITHNTINMNKNSVLINLNANIINTKTPIENYKVQQKLMEYKKYLNKKLNEINKKKQKKYTNYTPSFKQEL